jgi:hypothetical protein
MIPVYGGRQFFWSVTNLSFIYYLLIINYFYNVVHLALIGIRTHNISGNKHWLHR